LAANEKQAARAGVNFSLGNAQDFIKQNASQAVEGPMSIFPVAAVYDHRPPRLPQGWALTERHYMSYNSLALACALIRRRTSVPSIDCINERGDGSHSKNETALVLSGADRSECEQHSALAGRAARLATSDQRVSLQGRGAHLC